MSKRKKTASALGWIGGLSPQPPKHKAKPTPKTTPNKPQGKPWKIHVAAPVCMPIRWHIETAMNELQQRYGGSADYRIEGAGLLDNAAALAGFFNTQVDFGGEPAMRYPFCQVATIVVPEQRAMWVEYLLLRQDKITIYGQLYDERNRQWAANHGRGSLPQAWNEHGQLQPWTDSGCSVKLPTPKQPPPRKRWWQR